MATESDELDQMRAEIAKGYVASYKQKVASAGHFQGVTVDPAQTVGAGVTATVELHTVRFDTPDAPMVSGNTFLLEKSIQTYAVTANLEYSSGAHTNGAVYVRVKVWDGAAMVVQLAGKNAYLDFETTDMITVGGVVMSNLNLPADNYVCVEIQNSTDATLTLDNVRIGVLRLV
jgi:hypothetical protein